MTRIIGTSSRRLYPARGRSVGWFRDESHLWFAARFSSLIRLVLE
jgi:hypothetical protein